MYDVGTSDRTLEVGDFVLCKIPGISRTPGKGPSEYLKCAIE